MLAVRHDPCGHGSGFGGFLGREKPLSLSLNEIRWGLFQPPLPLPGRIFFLIIVLYLCHNTTSYKQQHYTNTTDLDYLFELNIVFSIMQIYCFCTLVEPQFSFRFFYFKVCVLAKIHQFISII